MIRMAKPMTIQSHIKCDSVLSPLGVGCGSGLGGSGDGGSGPGVGSMSVDSSTVLGANALNAIPSVPELKSKTPAKFSKKMSPK